MSKADDPRIYLACTPVPGVPDEWLEILNPGSAAGSLGGKKAAADPGLLRPHSRSAVWSARGHKFLARVKTRGIRAGSEIFFALLLLAMILNKFRQRRKTGPRGSAASQKEQSEWTV